MKQNEIKNNIIAIIPARMASTRLPGKPLLDVGNKPLIQRVWEASSQSKLINKLIIATDDYKIFDTCKEFGAEVVMTPAELPSGTDRIMNAYNKLQQDSDIIINIQGDEPLLTGRIIDNLLDKFINSTADVGTLIKKITDSNELFNPSVVKVELGENMIAKNFSRKPIPIQSNIPKEEWSDNADYWQHIGIYVYTIRSLKTFVSLPMSENERNEKLEQLRLLDKGYKYFCVETNAELIGVDTDEDLQNVKKYFVNKK